VTLSSHVLHTDDTQVKVRDAWKKLKHKGSFWTYVGDLLHPLTVYYRDVLARLPAMLPAASEEELLALLPHRWRPA